MRSGKQRAGDRGSDKGKRSGGKRKKTEQKKCVVLSRIDPSQQKPVGNGTRSRALLQGRQLLLCSVDESANEARVKENHKGPEFIVPFGKILIKED